MTNNTLKFSIKKWAAWGVGQLSDAEVSNNIKNGVPALDNIAPMVKRRMPMTAKYIYELYNSFDNSLINNSPAVFASKNAELLRTLKIIRSFETDVSPMQFSMSVHNAIAGLLSVITEDSNSYTIIDSLSGILETALIEAVTLLSENKYVKVVYFGEELPAELIAHYPAYNQPIILVLIVEKGSEISLSMDTHVAVNKTNKDDVLSLIKFLKKQVTNYHSSNDRVRWNWKNNAKA